MDKLIGVVSDTHGVLREPVREKLVRCDTIIHAGDIGDPEVLRRLKDIGRVIAVRGNIDRGYWTAALKKSEYVEVASDLNLYVLHDIGELDLDPAGSRDKGGHIRTLP